MTILLPASEIKTVSYDIESEYSYTPVYTIIDEESTFPGTKVDTTTSSNNLTLLEGKIIGTYETTASMDPSVTVLKLEISSANDKGYLGVDVLLTNNSTSYFTYYTITLTRLGVYQSSLPVPAGFTDIKLTITMMITSPIEGVDFNTLNYSTGNGPGNFTIHYQNTSSVNNPQENDVCIEPAINGAAIAYKYVDGGWVYLTDIQRYKVDSTWLDPVNDDVPGTLIDSTRFYVDNRNILYYAKTSDRWARMPIAGMHQSVGEYRYDGYRYTSKQKICMVFATESDATSFLTEYGTINNAFYYQEIIRFIGDTKRAKIIYNDSPLFDISDYDYTIATTNNILTYSGIGTRITTKYSRDLYFVWDPGAGRLYQKVNGEWSRWATYYGAIVYDSGSRVQFGEFDETYNGTNSVDLDYPKQVADDTSFSLDYNVVTYHYPESVWKIPSLTDSNRRVAILNGTNPPGQGDLYDAGTGVWVNSAYDDLYFYLYHSGSTVKLYGPLCYNIKDQYKLIYGQSNKLNDYRIESSSLSDIKNYSEGFIYAFSINHAVISVILQAKYEANASVDAVPTNSVRISAGVLKPAWTSNSGNKITPINPEFIFDPGKQFKWDYASVLVDHEPSLSLSYLLAGMYYADKRGSINAANMNVDMNYYTFYKYIYSINDDSYIKYDCTYRADGDGGAYSYLNKGITKYAPDQLYNDVEYPSNFIYIDDASNALYNPNNSSIGVSREGIYIQEYTSNPSGRKVYGYSYIEAEQSSSSDYEYLFWEGHPITHISISGYTPITGSYYGSLQYRTVEATPDPVLLESGSPLEYRDEYLRFYGTDKKALNGRFYRVDSAYYAIYSGAASNYYTVGYIRNDYDTSTSTASGSYIVKALFGWYPTSQTGFSTIKPVMRLQLGTIQASNETACSLACNDLLGDIPPGEITVYIGGAYRGAAVYFLSTEDYVLARDATTNPYQSACTGVVSSTTMYFHLIDKDTNRYSVKTSSSSSSYSTWSTLKKDIAILAGYHEDYNRTLSIYNPSAGVYMINCLANAISSTTSPAYYIFASPKFLNLYFVNKIIYSGTDSECLFENARFIQWIESTDSVYNTLSSSNPQAQLLFDYCNPGERYFIVMYSFYGAKNNLYTTETKSPFGDNKTNAQSLVDANSVSMLRSIITQPITYDNVWYYSGTYPKIAYKYDREYSWPITPIGDEVFTSIYYPGSTYPLYIYRTGQAEFTKIFSENAPDLIINNNNYNYIYYPSTYLPTYSLSVVQQENYIPDEELGDEVGYDNNLQKYHGSGNYLSRLSYCLNDYGSVYRLYKRLNDANFYRYKYWMTFGESRRHAVEKDAYLDLDEGRLYIERDYKGEWV